MSLFHFFKANTDQLKVKHFAQNLLGIFLVIALFGALFGELFGMPRLDLMAQDSRAQAETSCKPELEALAAHQKRECPSKRVSKKRQCSQIDRILTAAASMNPERASAFCRQLKEIKNLEAKLRSGDFPSSDEQVSQILNPTPKASPTKTQLQESKTAIRGAFSAATFLSPSGNQTSSSCPEALSTECLLCCRDLQTPGVFDNRPNIYSELRNAIQIANACVFKEPKALDFCSILRGKNANEIFELLARYETEATSNLPRLISKGGPKKTNTPTPAPSEPQSIELAELRDLRNELNKKLNDCESQEDHLALQEKLNQYEKTNQVFLEQLKVSAFAELNALGPDLQAQKQDRLWNDLLQLAAQWGSISANLDSKRELCLHRLKFIEHTRHALLPPKNESRTQPDTAYSRPTPSEETELGAALFDLAMDEFEPTLRELRVKFAQASGGGLGLPAKPPLLICQALRQRFAHANQDFQLRYMQILEGRVGELKKEFADCARKVDTQAKLLRSNAAANNAADDEGITQGIETLLELNRSDLKVYCK